MEILNDRIFRENNGIGIEEERIFYENVRIRK
jgi:hypothetical protein